MIPRTKLQPPRVRCDILSRSRLIERIRHALDSSHLLLLSAPAGSGKTTLLSSALAGQSQRQVAWLSLDQDDDDLLRFLFALTSALRRVVPQIAEPAPDLLLVNHADPQLVGRQHISSVINDLLDADPVPVVLVLDDLHALTDPEIFAVLDYLLEHLPPRLTVAVATRHDPPLALPRLRARRQVAELRLPDLRFTAEEASALLNDCLGFDLSPAEVADLHGRTEGWVAGLSLLASSLERIPAPADRTRFFARLAHTERYVFDYLAEEVLARQDPFVRMFLLETAILSELTPSACQAVTGRGDAAAILDQLYRRNLFLVAVDQGEGGAAYRYHDLFAAFLRRKVQQEAPEWAHEIKRRAAMVGSSSSSSDGLPDRQSDGSARTSGPMNGQLLAGDGGLRVPGTGEVLTPREVEVLRMLARGATNAAIAAKLIVSIHTVKTHVAHILPKLNVSSRTEAALRARELGVE